MDDQHFAFLGETILDTMKRIIAHCYSPSCRCNSRSGGGEVLWLLVGAQSLQPALCLKRSNGITLRAVASIRQPTIHVGSLHALGIVDSISVVAVALLIRSRLALVNQFQVVEQD